MMLWWGTQRFCRFPQDSEEAFVMCQNAALTTIQSITTFCIDQANALHTGLSWHATCFLFQAAIVLSIYHLKLCQPTDTGLAAVHQELSVSSFSKACDCLANLSQNNKAAAKCLEVLNRIRDRYQPAQHLPTHVADPGLSSHPDTMQQPTALENTDVHSTNFAIDPSLQILFQGTSWNNDIFEGLQGFPGTNEVGLFDHIPENSFDAHVIPDQPTDSGLRPTQAPFQCHCVYSCSYCKSLVIIQMLYIITLTLAIGRIKLPSAFLVASNRQRREVITMDPKSPRRAL